MLTVIIALLVVASVVEAAHLLRRRDTRFDEVTRFRMVRRITSTWSRHHKPEGSAVEG